MWIFIAKPKKNARKMGWSTICLLHKQDELMPFPRVHMKKGMIAYCYIPTVMKTETGSPGVL